MDYRQFMKLMEQEEVSSRETVGQLQEFINEFPYFQTAHALLAKAMHDQQHVRFDKQLKLAAAYSPDRKALYELIHSAEKLTAPEPVVAEDSPFVEVEREAPEAEVTDETIEDIVKEIPIEEFPVEEQPSPEAPFEESPIEALSSQTEIQTYVPAVNLDMEEEMEEQEELPPSDPHDIIRKRLQEILGLPAQQVGVKEEKVTSSAPASAEPVMKVEEEVEEIIDEPEIDAETPSPITEEPRVVEQEKEKEKEETIVEMPAPVSTIPVEQEKIAEPEESVQENKEEPVAPAVEAKEESRDVIEEIAKESGKAKDDIDKGELEYALENSILQSLEKLPPIEKAAPEKQPEPEPVAESGSQSFFGWLRTKQVGDFGKIEEVHAEDPAPVVEQATQSGPISEPGPDKTASASRELIDRFIETDPRIVPSKTEFYSPVSQAKKSVTEDENLVTETLAKIYYGQGHLHKARACYQKLSLLYPEKLAYFAALISGIDKEIGKEEKKD